MLKSKYFLIFCLVLVSGCRTSNPPLPAAAKPPENVPVLKQFIGRTDVVKVKHFFPEKTLKDMLSGTFIVPGHFGQQSVIAYEPGKEYSRHKGLRIDIVSTFFRENEYSRPVEHISFLDEDEASDLASSLVYMGQIAKLWQTSPPADDVEVTFQSKDDFSLSLLPSLKPGASPTLFVESGNANVSIPISVLDQLQSDLAANLAVLKSNEK